MPPNDAVDPRAIVLHLHDVARQADHAIHQTFVPQSHKPIHHVSPIRASMKVNVELIGRTAGASRLRVGLDHIIAVLR